MISSKFLATLAPVLSVLAILAALWLWLLDPSFTARAGFATGVMAGFMPTVWLGIFGLQRRGRIGPQTRQTLLSSLTLGGVLLLAAFGLKIAQHFALIDSAMPERTQGILLGLFMIVIGNALPKTLYPLKQNCSSAHEQALRRFVGWMFVLAGFGYALAWAFMAKAQADIYALPILVIPVVAAMARMLWVRLGHRKSAA